MSFDATEGDIQDFFAACEVTSVRIVEDKLDRKPKGFGYAEFATLDGLKKALEFNGTQFQGRNIRVSVAEPRTSYTSTPSTSLTNGFGYEEKERPDARDFGDWSRKGPLPDAPNQRRVSERNFGGDRDRGFDRGGGFGGRNFDNTSDAGSERPSRRPMYEQGDGKVRDFGNWERKGPLTPTLAPSMPIRNTERPNSHEGPNERRNSPAPAWGEGRSQDGSRPPRREFVDRPSVDRAPTAAEADNQWRSKMRPDPPAAPPAVSPTPSHKELSTPSSPAAPALSAAHIPPTTRPKLNLQKRTVSESEPSPSLASASSTTDPKASPFGAAKPIDTFAREKEIEEKRELAAKMKKEREEKAREEKRIADEKAKEERRIAKENERAEKGSASKEKSNGQNKEKDSAIDTPATKSYQILRRQTEGEGGEADEADGEEEHEGANGLITEDKAVLPQEIVRDMPGKKVNGVESQQSEAPSNPSAEALEGDGWSTVSKPRNNRKGGNQAARAIAS